MVVGVVNLIGCGVATLNYVLTEPPELYFPQNVKKVGVLNRSIPEEKGESILEGILTGEGVGTDRMLAKRVVSALARDIGTTLHLVGIEIPEKLKTTSATSFGEPLSLSYVREVCNRKGVDALVVLEYFDTDWTRERPKAVTEPGDPKRGIPPSTYYIARGTLIAKAGFRIYLPVDSDYIMAERSVYASRVFENRFNSLGEAAAWDIFGKTINVSLDPIATEISRQFIALFLPREIPRSVNVYTGKTSEVKECGKLVMGRLYDKAVSICKNSYENEIDPKQKSRIAHNISVAYEMMSLGASNENVLPLLDSAIQWSKNSVLLHQTSVNSGYMKYLSERRQHVAQYGY